MEILLGGEVFALLVLGRLGCFALLGYLLNTLFVMSGAFADPEDDDSRAGPYFIKAVTSVTGTPEDVVVAVTKKENREQWDPFVTTAEESGGKLVLQTQSGPGNRTSVPLLFVPAAPPPSESSVLKEQLSFTFHRSSAAEGSTDEHFCILESVNGRPERLYRLEQIRNKPYLMRVTLYIDATRQALKRRGRAQMLNLLNGLRTFAMNRDSAFAVSLSLRSPQEVNVRGSTAGENASQSSFLAKGESGAVYIAAVATPFYNFEELF